MSERVPSIFILVPGPWHSAEQVLRALPSGVAAKASQSGGPIKARELRVDVVEDANLVSAFRWGRSGPVPEQLVARIGKCSRAALVECGFRLDESPKLLAQIGRALQEAGGVAVRMEASGAASPWEPWLEHLESESSFQLYSCAVLLVRGEGGLVFTCGMHHFDLPDAQLETADPSEATSWLDSFCAFQLIDQPALASGHTFRPSADVPRRTIERWPDHRHHPNDGRHNPFGLWRLLEPGVRGVEVGRMIPVIIPPLVTLLLSTERNAKRPLSRSEVGDLVSKAPAMAMEARDAARLERSRGYADIVPERAWEQWQIVRETFEA